MIICLHDESDEEYKYMSDGQATVSLQVQAVNGPNIVSFSAQSLSTPLSCLHQGL